MMLLRSALSTLALVIVTAQISVTGILPNSSPRLIVFISIDQMRFDHLTRLHGTPNGGLQRLQREGVVFTEAYLNYAISATGPGHATLGTGVYPWKSGIVSNSYTDRKSGKKIYCVEDSTAGQVDGSCGFRSPRNLLVSGFSDWLKEASPKSRVISISHKDRAAILMGGKHPDAAYWFDKRTGKMSTSTYYRTSLPTWAAEFNSDPWFDKHLPAVWDRLLPESLYTRTGPDEMIGEEPWRGSTSFPHPIDPANRNEQAFNTPYGNNMLLDFARAAVAGEQLGTDAVTDLLCVSLSTTDYIGSSFGPDSHEMLDNLIRLDAAIASFLSDLERVTGKGKIVVALSADHGVMPLPEYASRFRGEPMRRVDNHRAVASTTKEIDSLLRSQFNSSEKIFRSSRFNESELRTRGADLPTVEREIRERLTKIDGITDVIFRRELADTLTPDRPLLNAFRHSFHTDRSPDYFLAESLNCLVTEDSTGTSHGTPYDYDTHVPIIFWGAGIKPQTVARRVQTVDIVATLGAMLSISLPGHIDGVPLGEIVSPR